MLRQRLKRVFIVFFLAVSMMACDNAAETVADPTVDAGPDAMSPDAVGLSRDMGPDAAPRVDMRCADPLPPEPIPSTRIARPIDPSAGIDDSEHVTWAEARRNLLDSPGVHFVATYHHGLGEIVVAARPSGDSVEFTFRRGVADDEPPFVVTGNVASIFPNTEVGAYGTAEALWAAFENPSELSLADYGYETPDPRVGFLPVDAHFFPRPLERLASLFESTDAPDLVYGVFPYASGGLGTHGGMSGLQSQATLILSGPGVLEGAVLDTPAALVDIAPTVLAALGAPTVGGRSSTHEFEDGLMLRAQDGRILRESMNPVACVRPEHAVIIVFDGLQALEINRQVLAENPDIDLPNFRRIAEAGAVYRYGALSGFPSYSAPGHSTVGTGVWPGHHGVLGNSYYSRAQQRIFTPFDLITGLTGFIADPESALELYHRLFSGGAENLAQATHRAFGSWDPVDETGAFVAVVNELTFLDADFSTLSFLNGGAQAKALPEYRVADGLAITQIRALMYDSEYPVPKVLLMSFLATDAAGESDGPNSPLLRDVLMELDDRLGIVLEAYEERGAFHKTLFVLTADHGMELQDRTRRARPQIGVRTGFNSAGLVYLRTLEVDVAQGSGPDLLSVAVRNHDNDAVVVGAEVLCAMCDPERIETNELGGATLRVLDPEQPIELEIVHPEFNTQHLRLQSLGLP